MLPENWKTQQRQVLVTMQIIAGAMLAGAAAFAGVAVFLAKDVGRSTGMPLVTYVAVGVVLALLLARLIALGVIVASNRRKIASGTWKPAPRRGGNSTSEFSPDYSAFLGRTGDAGRLMLVYQLRTLIAHATLEGAVFLLLVAHIVEGNWISLALAAALLLWMALGFPRESSTTEWVERQLRRVEEARQFRS